MAHMPIKQINVKAETQSSSNDMPVVLTKATVPGKPDRQLLTAFNQAREAFKKAEADMKEIEPEVRKLGIAEWVKANVRNAPAEPITAIKLVDANGSSTRFTGMNRYSAAD